MSQSSSAPMSAAVMTSGATKEQEETAMTGRSRSAFWGAAVMAGMPPAPNGKEESAAKLKIEMGKFPKGHKYKEE